MKVSVHIKIVETITNSMVRIDIPENVCSNTDEVGLPAWCVDVPDATLETALQLCGELCFLGVLFFLSYRFFILRKQRAYMKRLNKTHQPSK